MNNNETESLNNAPNYKIIRINYWKNYVLTVALIFFLVLGVIFERNLFQKVQVMINSLVQEKRDIESVVLPLEAEDRFLYRPERVDQVASGIFKMQLPGFDNVIAIEVQ